MGKPSTEVTKGASISARALAAQPAPAAIEINGVSFKAKQVTVPTLSQKGAEAVAFVVLEPMRLAKPMKQKPDAPKNMDPPWLVRVRDLGDGKVKDYAVNAILKSKWEDDDEYKNNAYVGKAFMIRKLPVPDGKRHRELEIMELTPKDE